MTQVNTDSLIQIKHRRIGSACTLPGRENERPWMQCVSTRVFGSLPFPFNACPPVLEMKP